MSTELLDIQPRELKFIFELKKQSSCSVLLVNKTDSPVAFKVKTTSPRKYCVRPNVGIVEPKSACEFIVTMQAQRIAPLDLVCKDKFLVQSTAVPEGTTDEDITSSMFSNDDSKYVEENKLRVVLVSPPHSPVLSPINGMHKQMPAYEAPELKDQVFHSAEIISPQKNKSITDISLLKSDSAEDITLQKNKSIEYSPQNNEIIEDVSFPNNNDSENISIQKSDTNEDFTRPKDDNTEDISRQRKVAEDEMESIMETSEELVREKSAEAERIRDEEDLELVKDIEKMKSKLNELESKLSEAEVAISKLTEERRLSTQEREPLRKELDMSKGRNDLRKVQVGFPFLFVVLVALVSIMLGNLLRC